MRAFLPWRRGRGSPDAVVTGAATVLAALMLLPIVAVLAALAAPGDAAWRHLVTTTLPVYAANTAALMLLVGALTLLIGVSTAWLTAMTEFPGRTVLTWLLVSPLAAPAYIIAYLYTDLLEFSGPFQTALRAMFDWSAGAYWFPNVRSVPGAALCLGLVLYPYVYLLARAAFVTQAGQQLLAARTLGLGPWRAFFHVALPGARPAIAGGLALVLMETLADYGVADYFAIPTFSTGIFRTWLAMGEKQAALKLAGVMLLVVAALAVAETLSRRGRFDDGARNAARMGRVILSRRDGLLALVWCVMPVLLGFGVPVGLLLQGALSVAGAGDGGRFTAFAFNSITVAGAAALTATGAALLLAYVNRRRHSRLGRGLIRLSTLGYALPGALLAVGLLGPLSSVDQVLTTHAARHWGWQGGLILTGSITILIYACVVRFLTVAFNAVDGGLARVPPAMDAAARSLGAGPLGLVWRVHLPLIRPALAAAALLVFVDVMRELPLTLLLRPFNFETLATRTYRFASDERLAEASLPALAIVLIGLMPVVVLVRSGPSGRRGSRDSFEVGPPSS